MCCTAHKVCWLSIFKLDRLILHLLLGYDRENGGSDPELIESASPRKVAYSFYHIRNVNQVPIILLRCVIILNRCNWFLFSFCTSSVSSQLISAIIYLILSFNFPYHVVNWVLMICSCVWMTSQSCWQSTNNYYHINGVSSPWVTIEEV